MGNFHSSTKKAHTHDAGHRKRDRVSGDRNNHVVAPAPPAPGPTLAAKGPQFWIPPPQAYSERDSERRAVPIPIRDAGQRPRERPPVVVASAPAPAPRASPDGLFWIPPQSAYHDHGLRRAETVKVQPAVPKPEQRRRPSEEASNYVRYVQVERSNSTRSTSDRKIKEFEKLLDRRLQRVVELFPQENQHGTRTERSEVPTVARTERSNVPVVARTDVPAVTRVERVIIPVGTKTERSNVPVVTKTERSNVPIVTKVERSNVPVVTKTERSNVPVLTKSKRSNPPVVQEVMGNWLSTSAPTEEVSQEPGQAWRKKAAEEARLRGEAFEASQEAYRSGRRAEAKMLSDKGKAHGLNMERYNARAEQEIFRYHNPTGDLATADLHGLYVSEALARVEKHIAACKKAGVKRTVFITGQGNHSKDGLAKIKPAVEKLLRKENLRATPDTPNPGCVTVDIDVPDDEVGWCVIM